MSIWSIRAPRQTPATMTLRTVTALAVLVSGIAHGYLYFFDGWGDIEVIGPLFMVNAVSGIVIAVLVLAWRNWVPLFLAFGFSLLTGAAFLISRWWGLFGIQDTVWGFWQILCLVAEAVGLVASLSAFLAERWLSGVGARPGVGQSAAA